MASIRAASIFSPSPTPVSVQPHGGGLPLYPPQRISFLKLSESTTAGVWSSFPMAKTQVACASASIELPASTKTLDAAAEGHEIHFHLTPLISELTEGAPLPSALEPWLDKLSMYDWEILVRAVGDKDWAMALQLVSYFKENASTLADSVLWPEDEKKADAAIGEDDVTGKGDALSGFSAATKDSTEKEAHSSTPKERSAIQELYKALAKVLLKNKRSDGMDPLLQQLKAEGVKPVASFYYIMLKSYLSENLTEKCSKLVSEMEQAKINILPATYERIAFSCLKKEPLDISVPTNIMRDLTNKGLPVSQSLFTALLKENWRKKDVEGVEDVFQTMVAAGHTPDQKAILKVMYCQKLVGNYGRILELIEMMNSLGITSSMNIYDELISAYCKAGLMEKAKESLSLYDTKLGRRPTLVALNNLIHGYGKQGRFEEALEAFEDIQNNDYRPDAVSYSSVISAMVNAGQLTKALQIYRRMVRQGLQPKLHTYITLIQGLQKLDWTRDGRKIVNAMRKSPHPLTPEAYGAIFSLFVEGHWYHLAASVLMEIEKEGIPLNAGASSGLIRSFSILDAKPTPLSNVVEKSNLEICKLLTALFLSRQSDDGDTMESAFEEDMIPYLKKLEPVAHARVVYNAFMDCLWKRGQKNMTNRLLKSAREVYAQSTKPEALDSEWILDIRGLSAGGAKCALSQWLNWVVEGQALSSNGNAKIAVAQDCGLNQSTVDTEILKDSKKLDISTMVIILDKENQLNVIQDHRMLRRPIIKMLSDLKAPFKESSEHPEKLEAHMADVRKWAISDKLKELVNVNDF